MLDKQLEGKWIILTMDRLDKAFIDLVEPGYIEFMDNGFGTFHFGCVYVNMDYRVNEQGTAEFSFYGDDEGQEVFGRGWVQIDNKELCGELLFHEGEEYVFQAAKEASVTPQVIFKRHLNSYSLNKKQWFA